MANYSCECAPVRLRTAVTTSARWVRLIFSTVPSLTKSELIGLLKASTEYCTPLVTALTDSTMSELVKTGQMQVAKGLLPPSLIAHGMEMYGTMAVYLRLKGIVPPSTERMNQQMKKNQ
jgi:hypothetical protein